MNNKHTYLHTFWDNFNEIRTFWDNFNEIRPFCLYLQMKIKCDRIWRNHPEKG